MIISSVIIKANAKDEAVVLKSLKTIKEVEIAGHEKKESITTVVAIIESQNLDSQISTFKTLEKLEGVLSVDLIFTSDEDDFDNDASNVGSETIKSLESDEIRYSGNLETFLKVYGK